MASLLTLSPPIFSVQGEWTQIGKKVKAKQKLSAV